MKHCYLFVLCILATSVLAQKSPSVVDFEGLSSCCLTAEKDTVHIVNFWATWCKPCVEELPYFERIAKEEHDMPVKVTLVSLDFKHQIQTKLHPFLEEHDFFSDVVVLYERNPNDWIDRVNSEWSGAIPATLFIKGDRQQFSEGQFASYDELLDIVKSF